jgi:hypothetical protein
MYIDLEHKSRKAMPVGFEYVGGLRDDSGAQFLLVRDRQHGGRFVALHVNGSTMALDQEAVADALAVAQMARPPLPDIVVIPNERKQACCVQLDSASIQTLRAYGNGNLSAGIRQAAKLLVGAV